jgi:hypothetical protein
MIVYVFILPGIFYRSINSYRYFCSNFKMKTILNDESEKKKSGKNED